MYSGVNLPAMPPKLLTKDLPERAPWEEDSSDEERMPARDLDDDLASVVSDSDMEEEVGKLSAGEELINVLKHLLLQSGLSAYYFCVICYWAWKAGAKGPCSKYAKKPGSRNAQRHIDRVDGVQVHSDRHMYLDMPSNRRCDMARASHRIPVVPLHEALDREI